MKQVWENRLHLVAHRLDHGRHGVADAGDGDARAQVDKAVAVDIDQDGPLRPLDVHRQERSSPRGPPPPPSGPPGPGTGDREFR